MLIGIRCHQLTQVRDICVDRYLRDFRSKYSTRKVICINSNWVCDAMVSGSIITLLKTKNLADSSVDISDGSSLQSFISDLRNYRFGSMCGSSRRGACGIEDDPWPVLNSCERGTSLKLSDFASNLDGDEIPFRSTVQEGL